MNERQELFIVEYLKDFNASRAARDAGYSEKTAGQTGYDLLKNPQIRSEIDKRFQAIIKPKQKIVLDVVNTLTGILADDNARHSDKIGASKVLAQYAGMLTDKVEISGAGGEPIRFEIVRHGDSQDN